MKGLMVLLALCAFTAAMVPMQRREALNSEEEEKMTSETTTESEKKICALQTPCAWSIYKPGYKIIDINLTNTYCECGVGTTCQFYEDDSTSNSFVYTCRS